MNIPQDVLDQLIADEISGATSRDVLEMLPNLTIEDAYKVQFARVERQIGQGDTFVGYQASMTSAGSQSAAPNMPIPLIGSMLASQMCLPGSTVTISGGAIYGGEIGVLLKRDIEGPNATVEMAYDAIEGYFPALEIVALKTLPNGARVSDQHLVVTHKAGGCVAMGEHLVPKEGIDPRLEGIVASLNGKPMRSATGVEAMGNPLNVLVAMANNLSNYGRKLEAGTKVITGSMCEPIAVTPKDSKILVEFTRLGAIELNIAD